MKMIQYKEVINVNVIHHMVVNIVNNVLKDIQNIIKNALLKNVLLVLVFAMIEVIV